MNVVMSSLPASVAAPLALDESVDRAAADLLRRLADPGGAIEPLLAATRALERVLECAGCAQNQQHIASLQAASCAVAGAYWHLFERAGGVVSPVAVARVLADAVKWQAIARFATVPEHWRRLGVLLVPELESGATQVSGDVESVGRHYLRALAYHSAGLEQLAGEVLWDVVRLVEQCLPLLAMSRWSIAVPHYVADPEAGAVPRRTLSAHSSAGFHFSTVAASEHLSAIERRGEIGAPAWSADSLLALHQLQRAWGSTPPVRRNQRHPMKGGLQLARGVGACLQMLSAGRVSESAAWSVCDVSRSSMAISAQPSELHVPALGELVGIRFNDSALVHLGVVRRMRIQSGGLLCGLQLMSRDASCVTLEDGRVPVPVLLCDPVSRGEAVRLVAEQSSVLKDGPLFLKADAAVFKLRPLGEIWSGLGFAMRAYQLV